MLSSSGSLGCGAVEPLGGASGCLLGSPGAGDQLVAVRISPQPHATVFVGKRRHGFTNGHAANGHHEPMDEDQEFPAWDQLPGT